MNALNRFSINLVILLCISFVVIALTAPLIAPHNPEQGVLLDRLQPPVWLEGGDSTYLLGTDKLGRDVLSRLIYGARISLTVCALAIILSGVIGSTLGIIAGYYGGWPERILMRLVDLTLSFPIILLALLFGVIYGPSFLNVIIVISLVLWSQYARMARGETLKIKTTEYVELARTAGASDFYIMRKHILPNIVGALIVLATLQVGTVIILESSLSFLGVGVPPPTPSWGSMIADGRSYVMSASWLSIVPGLSILLTVLSVNILGDHLTDVLNPRMRMNLNG
ncbi:MAG: ABC transporter permease [Cellvibrionaceae bacterium]